MADEGLHHLSIKIASIEQSSDSMATLASKDKLSEYVSELMVRINEINLKIAENEMLIKQLKTVKISENESNLYGTVGKISILSSENDLLHSRLNQISQIIVKLKNELKSLAIQSEQADEIKKKSDIDYSRYRELTTALEKLRQQNYQYIHGLSFWKKPALKM